MSPECPFRHEITAVAALPVCCRNTLAHHKPSDFLKLLVSFCKEPALFSGNYSSLQKVYS